MKEEIKNWIEQSEHDLGTAEILLKETRLADAAFYCQQAVEKALKALMLKRTNSIRKIHDLVQLGKIQDFLVVILMT